MAGTSTCVSGITLMLIINIITDNPASFLRHNSILFSGRVALNDGLLCIPLVFIAIVIQRVLTRLLLLLT